MRCADILKPDVAWVTPGATVGEAARVMQLANVEVAPVCDASGFIVGVLTGRDIAVSMALGDIVTARVRDVMSSCALVCALDDEISTAQLLMRQFHVSEVVCMNDNGHAVGMLRLKDIARYDREGARETLTYVKCEFDRGEWRMPCL